VQRCPIRQPGDIEIHAVLESGINAPPGVAPVGIAICLELPDDSVAVAAVNGVVIDLDEIFHASLL
jgi:hypothetical protein